MDMYVFTFFLTAGSAVSIGVILFGVIPYFWLKNRFEVKKYVRK